MTGDAGGGVVSLEVRWIHPGRLPALLAERLEPFAEGIEVREDRYLTDPVLADVSVKIRGGVPSWTSKAFRHSPGRLSLPGGTRGGLELSEKWSVPLADVPQPLIDPCLVGADHEARRRRSFALADGELVERPLAGCHIRRDVALEVTEVSIDGTVWWTLGLEAVGPLETLHRDLQITAMRLIDDRLSARFGLHSGAAKSYHQQLQIRRTRR